LVEGGWDLAQVMKEPSPNCFCLNRAHVLGTKAFSGDGALGEGFVEERVLPATAVSGSGLWVQNLMGTQMNGGRTL